MGYDVVTRWGGGEDNPSEARMREILAELDTPDQEHPDTWLTTEEGWTISISERGIAVWDNFENDRGPRFREGVNRDEALQLWLLLSRGRFEEIESLGWKEGQGPPISPEELESHRRRVAGITLKFQRDFYDRLGIEDLRNPCRHQGCTRGAVKFSIHCRIHHFEDLYKQPCPFNH